MASRDGRVESKSAGSNTTEGGRFRRRLPKSVLAGLGVVLCLPGVVIAGFVVSDLVRLVVWEVKLHSPDADVRRAVYDDIAHFEDRRALDLLLKALPGERDRNMIAHAGYVIMRTKQMETLPVLREYAEAGPDDSAAGRLLISCARLSRRDQRLVPWLQRQIEQSENHRRFGGGAGLLYLARPQGGDVLIELARRSSGGFQQAVARELGRFAEPMSQAVGQPIDWPAPDESDRMTDAFWNEVQTFWDAYATPRLIEDILARRLVEDSDWYEIGRLIHAREKAAKVLQ